MGDILEQTVGRLVEHTTSTYFGKYRGIVTDVDDPSDLCRIRAKVPAILGDEAIGWAMPASPFAGNGHGMVMLPAVDSGVWIEFEAGRLDNPIWTGTWWASGERPDPKGAAIRVFVSEHGHKVIIDDESDEVKIVHGSGPEIKMTGSEIVLTCGACEIKIGSDTISMNNGMVKVGPAGVSLVNGAMSLGVAP